MGSRSQVKGPGARSCAGYLPPKSVFNMQEGDANPSSICIFFPKVGLSDLSNKNTGYPAEFELQVSNNYLVKAWRMQYLECLYGQ